MRILMLSATIFTATLLFGQKKSVENNFLADFYIFVKYLEETHPDPYSAFGGKINFRNQIQNTRKEIENITTPNQLQIILTELISQLEDGHSFIRSSENVQNIAYKSLCPIQLHIATDAIFIGNATEEYTQFLGSKILAINDIKIEELLKIIKKYGSYENDYGAMVDLCDNISKGEKATILVGNISPVKFTIQDGKGNISNLHVPYEIFPTWIIPHYNYKKQGENNLMQYGILKDENIGYFVWNSFVSREVLQSMDPNNPQLQSTLTWAYNAMRQKRPEDIDDAIKNIPSLYDSFYMLLSEMEAQKSNYLIIDLRNNGGGMTPLCLPLLYMLYGDDYLNYNKNPQYTTLISPLWLKKLGFNSIEEYNSKNNTNFILGDYIFKNLLPQRDKSSIEEKRKDYSLITYNGIGKEYTENLNGKPVYRPRVIVLSSPKTFSAAYHFMYYLSEIGRAKIVGVPSKQAGNSFMETTIFELPYSRIRGSISNSKQIMFPDEVQKGKILMPDFPLKWSDFLKYNIDSDAELQYCIDLIKQGLIE